MTYQYLNNTELNQSLMYIFVYANEVTHNLFMPFFVFGFFIIVFLSSLMFQLKFNARIRPEVSFLASSFATFCLTIILMQVNGLISPIIFVINLVITVVALIWVINSSGE